MRIVRFQAEGGAPQYGWLLEDKVGGIQGDPFGRYRRRDADKPLSSVKLLAPCVPSKIVCVGRNYVEHAKELGNDVPKIPLLFFKPPSAIINPGDTIILPPQSKQVEHEAELVAVIGRRARNVTAEEAKKHIFGYTVGNDVTARDLQKIDGQRFRYVLPVRAVDRHRVQHSGRAHHLQGQWTTPPNGLDAGHGVQRRHPDRVYLVGDDAGAGRPGLHRHTVRGGAAPGRE
jgi:hypothetical protein